MEATTGPAADGGRRPYAAHPAGWRVVETAGVGPFVTRAVYEDPQGRQVEWTSRRHRTGGAHPAATPVWHLLGWWVGALFIVGSSLFALGSLPYVAAHADPHAVAMTYVVGAVFFTSAAALQYVQALRAPRTVVSSAVPGPRRRGDHVFDARRIDCWAGGVQFVGTLFFNITTIAALHEAFTTQQEIVRVWAPDALGSVCFLVASELAVLEVCHRWWCRARGDVGRRIARINMIGSVFFGVSAITSFILPGTGEVIDAEATNTFTFLGAVCFGVAAWLVTREARATRG